MFQLAQAYWVTNSFDMNSFNVLLGKSDGLITRIVGLLRAKRGGPGLSHSMPLPYRKTPYMEFN